MNPSPSSQIALITGANKGIGKEIARGLGRQGFTVIVGARDEAKGLEVVNEFEKEDIKAHAVKLEVTDDASVAAATRFVTENFGKLDVLVNNAGIITDESKPSEADLALVKKVYETNVFAPIRMIQHFLPLLKKSQTPRIVNMSSGLGSLGLNSDPSHYYATYNVLGYCTSKTALNAITVQFANELRSSGILVNSACPGYCATDLNAHSGPRTPTQGAQIAIHLATLPNDGPTGAYFNDDGKLPW